MGRDRSWKMVNSYGLRSGTRDLFSKSFRKHGHEHLTTYLVNYKVGDFVDVVVNSAIHKGMPHKYYHGKTGRVFNVTPRAVGVEINKHVTPKGDHEEAHPRPHRARQEVAVP